MSVKYNPLIVMRGILILLTSFIIVACGGGGGGDSGNGPNDVVDVNQLDGIWSGSLHDSVPGSPYAYQLTISGGNITKIFVDGADTGITGTITKESDVLFLIDYSDGYRGSFLVDRAVAHAAFMGERYSSGVVQKGAGSLPTFLISDADGNWAGHTVVTDFTTIPEVTSTASCTNLICSSSTGGVTAEIYLDGFFDGTYGRWVGAYTNTMIDPGETSFAGYGETIFMLSIDKQFASSFECDNIAPYLEGCELSALIKQ